MAGLARLSVEDIAAIVLEIHFLMPVLRTSLDNWKNKSALNWIVKEVNLEETAVKMKMTTG